MTAAAVAAATTWRSRGCARELFLLFFVLYCSFFSIISCKTDIFVITSIGVLWQLLWCRTYLALAQFLLSTIWYKTKHTRIKNNRRMPQRLNAQATLSQLLSATHIYVPTNKFASIEAAGAHTAQKYYFNCNPQMHSGEPIVLQLRVSLPCCCCCCWCHFNRNGKRKATDTANETIWAKRQRAHMHLCEKIQFNFSLVLEMRRFFIRWLRFAFLLQYHHRVIVMIISNVSLAFFFSAAFGFSYSPIITIVYICWVYDRLRTFQLYLWLVVLYNFATLFVAAV